MELWETNVIAVLPDLVHENNILLYLEVNPLTILILNSQTNFGVFCYLKQLQAFPSSFFFFKCLMKS